MFNSTHTLVGVSLARAGLDKWAPHAMWTAVIASNLPDIDIVTEFHSTATYIAYHRGITHTLIGVPLLSVLLAGVMHAICGKFRRHLAIAFIAMSTHPALDYLNTYGIRPLLPWDSMWSYGDILFIIDPLFDLILLAGILAGHWLHRKQAFAAAGIALVVIYVGSLAQMRNMARDKFGGQAVAPQPLDPFRWIGFQETADALTLVEIDPFRGVQQELTRLTKSPKTAPVEAAEASRTGRIFMEFARFPIWRVSSGPEGHLVQLIDARFYRVGSNAAFAAEIRLDRELNVVSEDIGFNMSLRTAPD